MPYYSIVTSLTASSIALLIGIALLPYVGNSAAFMTGLLAVTVSSWYKGLLSGMITIILLLLGIIYCILPPQYSFALATVAAMAQILLFVVIGVVINFLIDKLRNTDEALLYKEKEKDQAIQIATLMQENRQYKKEVQARDEFLSIASHELKTPLAAMLLQLQLALHNIRNVSLANFSVDKLLKMLQSTEQQSRRLSKMINDLLNVSLITTGRMELEKEKTDLSELAKNIVERFSERAEKEGFPITIIAPTPVVGEWDKLRIEQAVTNLISNAIKYGNSEPITVAVEMNEGLAMISVTDSGIGIPHDKQDRIFERFERAVPNSAYKGLGVGLYITKHIIKTHNGKISLVSKPNNGSTFIIELPLNFPEIVQPEIGSPEQSKE